MQAFESKSSSADEYFKTDHLKTALRESAVRGAGATVFSQVLTYGIQMISTIVLARLLTPDDFGLVAMVIYIFMLFKMYRNLGLIDATIQKEKINHRQISTLFWINLVFSIVIALVFMALGPLIAWFYNEPKLKSIASVISVVFVFGALSTQHEGLLKRNMQFYRITATLIIATTTSAITAIALAWKGWGYWALVAKHVTFELATAVGVWISCRWRPGFPAFGTGVGPMLRFGANSLGSLTANYFSQNLDKVLIGWRSGTESLGYYDKAYQLFMAPTQQLAYPLTHVSIATLSRLCRDPERYRSYYLKALSMLAFIGLPMSALLALIGNDLILLLLGPQWKKAGVIFSIFSIGIGTQILYGTHGWLHISLGRTDRWFRWGIVGSMITVTSFLIALPFGPLAVAVAYIVSLHVLTGPCLWYAGQPISLKLHSVLSVIWKYYLSALGAGLLCWFILYSFDLTSGAFASLGISVRLVLSSVLCIFVYLLLIIGLYRNTKPISQFISIVREMVPSISRSKQNERKRPSDIMDS